MILLRCRDELFSEEINRYLKMKISKNVANIEREIDREIFVLGSVLHALLL
jgi:hypothetical protein